jgi:hypothetical protein
MTWGTLFMLAACGCARAIAADVPPLACAPEKPVVVADEVVQVTAWATGQGWSYRWSANAGQITPQGRNALWDFASVAPGRWTVKVEAARAGGATSSCEAHITLESAVETRGERVTRRFLLAPKQQEPRSYGLYSYILLTNDGGDPAARERNQKTIEAWQRKIPEISALERSEPAAILNGTFVPVSSAPPANSDPVWILGHYDYNRSDRLLQKLAGAHLHGPYLVSSSVPLNERRNDPILILDASWAPPRTVSFWIDAFLNQAAQERFDNLAKLTSFELKLRTMISVLADGLPEAREALASILTLSK